MHLSRDRGAPCRENRLLAGEPGSGQHKEVVAAHGARSDSKRFPSPRAEGRGHDEHNGSGRVLFKLPVRLFELRVAPHF